MKAVVKEIQVGGIWMANSLEDACFQYVHQQPTRTKINFAILLPSGETKYITIRDEDNCTVAYGDFEGLPNALDYAQDLFECERK